MEALAKASFEAGGMPTYPMVVTQHPVAGLDPNIVKTRITPTIFDQIVKALTTPVKEAPPAVKPKTTQKIVYQGKDLIAAIRAMNDDFLARNWGDGFPLIPPTPILVKEMLKATKMAPTDEIGILGPRNGKVTVENLAINAVMAGCRPEYMSVLIAMMQAALKPEFNLAQINVTTNPVVPTVILSGPMTDVSDLNVNSGTGVFGPGWQANATIGRTLALLTLTTGGATPGPTAKGTHKQFAKYSAAWAVDRMNNPFPSLQEQLLTTPRRIEQITNAYKTLSLGTPKFEPVGKDENVVIMFGLLDRNNVNDNNCTKGECLLNSIATAMLTAELARPAAGGIDGQYLIVLGPQHAKILASDGWTIDKMRQFLYKEARYPLKRWVPSHTETLENTKKDWVNTKAAEPFAADGNVPMVKHPEDFFFTVAGGPGSHSAVFIGAYGTFAMQKVTK